MRIMDKILTGIAGLPINEMENKSVTVSIGMHDYDGTDSKSSTFQQADDALYEAKNRQEQNRYLLAANKHFYSSKKRVHRRIIHARDPLLLCNNL